MWVFDGEEWTQDLGSDSTPARPAAPEAPRHEELIAELQVVEIVQRPRNGKLPPLPMP